MKHVVFALLLSGCSAAALPPASTPIHSQANSTATHYLYVTDRTAETLSVYNLGGTLPIRTIPLAHAGGVAVNNGDVYVADGADVREYSPGAARLIKTFSAGFADAVNVAVSNGSVYVADDGPEPGPPAGKIVVLGKSARTIATRGNWYPHALAVDAKGDVFYEISGIGDAWPFNVNCLGINLTYEILAGSQNPVQIGIRNHPERMKVNGRLEIVGEQDWGFALSGSTLYVSDACLGVVKAYYPPAYSYPTSTYVGTWSNLPFYPGVGSGFLAVPQARTGEVFVQSLLPSSSGQAVLTGLQAPIGTAISP